MDRLQNQSGEAVGMAAVFPRWMYREGKTCLGVFWETFASARNTGVWVLTLQLQRACLACARSEEFAVAYDFPSTYDVAHL